jgi:L-ascorbate metabolism protein UlaG (beta-lactamase superfamily)
LTAFRSDAHRYIGVPDQRRRRASIRSARHHERVPMFVELRDSKGQRVLAMPDPSGGTFDAAGDFDRFFDETYAGHLVDLDLAVLGSVDPYADTEMHGDDMAQLLEDIDAVPSHAKAGPELRGLLRLQVMAQRCADDHGSRLMWLGD